jgi:hypothetical protein
MTTMILPNLLLTMIATLLCLPLPVSRERRRRRNSILIALAQVQVFPGLKSNMNARQ